MPSPSGPEQPGRAPACPPPPGAGAPGRGPVRRGYRAVFAVTEFRYVFAAHLLSSLGVVVCEIALSVLVFRLTGSPLLSALTFALGLLPYVLGGTLLSAVADRPQALNFVRAGETPIPSRRRVLVLCDALCAPAAAAMALPGVPVAVLLALRCVIAAVAPVFAGTRAGTLGEILGEGDPFVLGRSLIRIVNQGAQLAGFAAGGLLLTAVPPGAVLGITAGTFACSALLLRLGTAARPARGASRRGAPSSGGGGRVTGGRARGALLDASLAGTRRLLADRRIRALLLLGWVPPAVVVVPEALLVPYGDLLGTGPAGAGLLMCSMPIGAVAAETLVGSFLGPRARARLTFPMGVFAVLPSLGFAARPSLGWAVLLLVLTGTSISYNFGVDRWFAAAVPDGLLGQAMTVMQAGRMTIMGVAMGLAGVAADHAPLPVVMPAAGVVGGVCVLAVIAEVRRSGARPGTGPRRAERARTA
ncbi:MFS transporter [Streptomyces albospinus]|uniref:MFS transporter n=1 Tax=Streptomyces albospinus TaxID=285515 RepID=A0ABQ2ULU9_9ACTN|nr:MFS transporter [Streptomyces albospinus]GGU43963.1 MFS transporter [Streptomyces albospinus]